MPGDVPRAKGRAFAAGAALLALVASFAFVEIALRAGGYPTWQPAPLPEVPILQEPDPELGWRNKPGVHRFRADPPIVLSIWPDGYRATAGARKPRARQVLLLGGSFTQGWAVDDAETYGALLQRQMPEREVLNLGTAGYGAYQSLLALERHLASAERPPELVLFGFNDFHQERDVAAPAWLRMLSQLSQLGAVAAPYATLSESGELERHAPLTYPDWPGKRTFATIAFLEERSFALQSRSREARASEVTEAVLLAMNETSRAAGSRLLVAVLSDFRPEHHQHYLNFLRERGIEHVDCAYPDDGSQSLVVPRYGHPNAVVNAYWAQCIAAVLDTPGDAR